MKKFTSFMLMLLVAATTWGQVVEGQMYRLKENNQGLYLTIRSYNGEGEDRAYGTVPFLAKATANPDQVWYFENTGTEGVYNLKSKSGYYITHGDWNVNAYNETSNKGQVQLVDQGNSTYKIKNVNAGTWYKSQIPGWGEDVLHPFCDASEAAACIWALEIVEESEFNSAINVTYNFLYNGNVVLTQTSTIASGSDFPEITIALPFGMSATKPAGTVTAENATQSITLVENLPFEYATTYEDVERGENWYYLNFHATDKNKLYYDGTENVLDATKTAVDLKNKDAYSWAFVGDPINGFKIVNRAAGASKALNAVAAGAIVGEGSDNIFKLTASSHGENGFFIQCTTGNNTQRFNRQNSKVVYWSGADAGSTFIVEQRIMGPVADLEELIEVASTKLAEINANIGTAIGNYTQATADALSAAITTAQSKGDAAVESDVTTLQAAIDAARKVLPIAGKYYQLHSSLAAFAETKALYAGANGPGWKTLNSDDKSFYWEAVETGKGIALKNASNGKYLLGNESRSSDWSFADTYTDAEIDVKILATTENEKGNEYAIIITGWQMHANSHGGGNGTNGNIVSYNTDEANSASSWYIVEAELPAFYNVTYNYKYNDKVVYTETIAALPDAAYPDLTYVTPYGVAIEGTVPEGNVTGTTTVDIALTVEKELPFETAATVDGIAQWYYVRMHTNQPGYIGEIAENNTINVDWGKTATAENKENFVWGFVGDVFSGVKVINKGTGKQLTSTGDGNATLTNDGTPFFVAPTTETSTNATNGFCLRKQDSNNYLNANYSAGKLAHWSKRDAGSTFFLTEADKTTEVTITEVGYATLFLNYAAYIPEGVEAYIIKKTGTTDAGYNFADMTQVTGSLPENTGVILKNAGTYNFVASAEGGADTTGNLLKGTATSTNITAEENTEYYVLAMKDSKAVLGKAALNQEDGTAFLNNANKAYLPITTTSAEAAAFYSLGFDWGGTTGIENIEGATEENNAVKGIYDLTGRKIETITAPGIYIVNGKKMLVK